MGLGSNLGDREEAIRHAVSMIEEQIGPVEAQSALFYSEPWGFASENGFVNAAVRVVTALTPCQLLDVTQDIERRLGKDSHHATERASRSSRASSLTPPIYHDRPIDIDILLYDALAMSTPRLTIPHPLMHQRPFVMEPLRQVLRSPTDCPLPRRCR